METVSIAEKVLDKMNEKKEKKTIPPSRNLQFRKSFALRRNKGAEMLTPFSITDDSGFIPFEKEIERFEASGEAYQKFMRMAFPNGSVEKVVNDYAMDFGAMSRLDAVNFVKNKSVELQSRLNMRAINARNNVIETENPGDIQINQPTEPEAPKA